MAPFEMLFTALWLFAMLFSLATASPLPVVKRNPCDGIDAIPILYHDYLDDVCPARNHLRKDGFCEDFMNIYNGCVSYCQLSQSSSITSSFDLLANDVRRDYL